MEFRDIFKRVQKRVDDTRKMLADTSAEAGTMMRSIIDSFSDDGMNQAFQKARERLAPARDQLPVDFQLRQSSLPRRLYERLFPVSHVFRIGMKYGREHLEDFMPLSGEEYIGRGSYKFVYRLPWREVIKVSKDVLPSDPLFGSMFREVDAHPDRFFTPDELELWNFSKRGKSSYQRDRLRFKFNRLGMERYHYWRVRKALPELVLPTRFFMGVRYRKAFIGEGHTESMTPMDSQILLVGKHLKEFARAGKAADQNFMARRLSPKFDFEFDSGRFGRIKKKVLVKITEDFRRLIKFTEELAVNEKLILDIHTENIIITLPDFELKVFDFHLFDEHLYEVDLKFNNPEKDHIEVIEKFIESFDLSEAAGDEN
ncbi:MAG: hypothetical protein HY042_06270 [Spirochaetia bacterium]|nr:hypothetical protein [Spirochaetia bacterium]